MPVPLSSAPPLTGFVRAVILFIALRGNGGKATARPPARAQRACRCAAGTFECGFARMCLHSQWATRW